MPLTILLSLLWALGAAHPLASPETACQTTPKARPQTYPDERARLLEDGRKALDDGEFSDALSAFEACLEVAPDDHELHGWLAVTHLRIARSLIRGNGIGAAISAELSDAEMAARRACDLSVIRARDPNPSPDAPPSPWRLLMEIHRLQGRTTDAIEDGRQAIELGDMSAETVAGLADALIEIHRQNLPAPTDAAPPDPAHSPELDEAIERLSAARSLIARAADKDPAGARTLAAGLRGTSRAPAFSDLSRKLGVAYEFAGELDKARLAYQAAIDAKPDSLEAHTDLYNFVTRASDQLDATLAFYHDLESDTDALVWWFQGQIGVARANKAYNDSKPARALFEYASAAGSFETSAAIEPAYDADAAQMITMTDAYEGWALMKIGNSARAEARFIDALEKQPGMQNAIQGLDQLGGQLYQASSAGKIPLAAVRDFFDRISKLAPENIDWWNNLGLFARDTQQYEKAYEAYRHAAKLAPDNARIQNDCALILVHHLHRDLDEAEERLLTAIRLGRKAYEDAADEAARSEAFSAYTDALSNLALLYDQSTRPADCKQVLEELDEIQPGRPDVTVLRAKVSKTLGPMEGE